MSGRTMRADVLSELNSLTQVGVVANLSDAQLLDRFLGAGGETAEAAFHALVVRHGAMVLSVCGNMLRDPNDVQDAFQATFLVLASRASSIRRHNALAGWLLAVARRVALRARADLARRRAYERTAAEMKLDHEASPQESWPELHEEIARLAQRYREVVVLCYLEGMSTDAAALRIGCPKGTVLSRLSRAREQLRRKLTRRGLPPPASLLPAALRPEATQTAFAPGLLERDRSGVNEVFGPSLDSGRSGINGRSLPRHRSELRDDDHESEDSRRNRAGLCSHVGLCTLSLASPEARLQERHRPSQKPTHARRP